MRESHPAFVAACKELALAYDRYKNAVGGKGELIDAALLAGELARQALLRFEEER